MCCVLVYDMYSLRFVLYVNGEEIVTDLKADDRQWHHVFVTWASEGGAWQIYLDGQHIESGTGLANNTVIQGGLSLYRVYNCTYRVGSLYRFYNCTQCRK